MSNIYRRHFSFGSDDLILRQFAELHMILVVELPPKSQTSLTSNVKKSTTHLRSNVDKVHMALIGRPHVELVNKNSPDLLTSMLTI